MAGMMPVQAQQSARGGSIGSGSTGVTTANEQQTTNGQTGGTGGNNGEPNAQGVKTFSIKL